MRKTNKVSVIGAGFVGSATSFVLMTSGLVSNLVLVDVNREKAEGEIMDLAHGASFIKSIDLKAGDYKDTQDSDIVIITAGAGQKPGETRLDLVNKNVAIFKSIVPQVVKYSPEAIILVVANPVDILTYVTYKLAGLPSNRVIGSGTVLDTSRLRYVLSEKFDVDARNVHSYIIGEHGDSEFPVWSSAYIGSLSVSDYCKREGFNEAELKQAAYEEVKNSAYAIIDRKGYTNYAIALAVKRIVEAILRDERSILTVSTYNSIDDVYYAAPNMIGRNGQIMKVCPNLNELELEQLENSKKVLKDIIKDIKL